MHEMGSNGKDMIHIKTDVTNRKIFCIQVKFRPRFIFTHFALWPEGEFKTGPIELYIKDYIR